jgi:hypothetical protein
MYFILCKINYKIYSGTEGSGLPTAALTSVPTITTGLAATSLGSHSEGIYFKMYFISVDKIYNIF